MYDANFSAMTPRTAYTDALQSTGWSLREWSRRSGVSVNTLLAISAGRNRKPQRGTLRKLVAALRESARDFTALADSLESE